MAKDGSTVEKSFLQKRKLLRKEENNMLMPKRVKYRREHRGKMRGRAKGGTEVAFGELIRFTSTSCFMDYKPSNRSCSSCNDSLHETWR